MCIVTAVCGVFTIGMFLVAAAVVLVPLIVLVLIYNGLISKRNQVQNAFSTIDVMLKKRFDLVPNLVEAVKGYAAHERGIFEEVAKARAAMAGAKTVGEKAEADGMLTGALKSLFAVAENYPQLKASDNFMHLQRALTELEEQISAARRAYNAAVLNLNNACDMFPSNIIASAAGFKRAEFFQATESERSVPEAPKSFDKR
jgi:LemA protein